MWLRFGLVFSLLMLPASLAAAKPTENEQRLACMGDAVKLCFWDIPNRAKIEECMASKHDELSSGCRVVFDASRAAEGTSVVKH